MVRNRPVYAAIFIDAIVVKVRDGQVANRPFYAAIGVTVDGRKDVLGLWAGTPGDGEGAKYWLAVLTELKNRGVADTMFVVCDGLKGLPEVVETTWPDAIVQTSSMHHGRGGIVPLVVCAVAGRADANKLPSRSTCRPVHSRRGRLDMIGQREQRLPERVERRDEVPDSRARHAHGIRRPEAPGRSSMVTSTASEHPSAVFAGIDWGGTHHQICIVDDTGTIQVQRKIEHTVTGFTEIDDLLDVFASRSILRVSIERAEGILVEHLLGRGESVFCISPKISARARERYRIANTKSDTFDAFVLADTLRHEHAHWRPLSRNCPLTARIAALSRDRERVIVMQRAVESRLRATLEAYHPGPLHLFSSLDRDITLAFIRDYPTPAAAARVTEDRMRRFCARHGYTGRVDPAVLVDRLRPHLLSGADGTIAGKQVAALMLVDQLELLNTNIRNFNTLLAPLITAHPDGSIFTSFPGIATVIAATMIGEMGDDRARFPTAATLLAEAGLAPVTRALGRTRQVRFRYAANKRLRHSIDWWMTVAAREDPWSAHIYDHARKVGQGRYRAYRGLGARWTRVLWRAWNNHEPFDPCRVHHEVPAA